MKYLLTVLFALAFFSNSSSTASASDFHVKVLDPNVCLSNPSACIIFNATDPITVNLTASTCTFAGVTDLPSDPSTYGCAVLLNFTLPPENITSINLTFSGLEGLSFECDTAVPGSIFSESSCGTAANGDDTFSFYNGSLPFLGEAVIYESGVDPDLFQGGTGTVNQPPIIDPVPEPNSLLLFSTGMLITGLYVTRQRHLFSFAKK